MIKLKIKHYRVSEVCLKLGISPVLVNIINASPEQDGHTVFGRAFDGGVVNMYEGSFELAYRGALVKAHGVPLATPQALLQTLSATARTVLLHELWHCKQFAEGRHLELSPEEAEAEATAFAKEHEGCWPDLASLSGE